ncbi:hypothetical protein GCM10029992_47550 [Glycomyces albus]
MTVSVLGSLLWSPMLLLAGIVGAGLAFAGLSGSCLLGALLAKLPFNRSAAPSIDDSLRRLAKDPE